MGVLSLNDCCGKITIPETVSNAEWCHPFKDLQGQDIGASCDELLVSNPRLLDADGWKAEQASWLADGGVPECTSSKSMINMKVFIEDTCSQVPCDEKTKQMLMDRLDAISRLGVR